MIEFFAVAGVALLGAGSALLIVAAVAASIVRRVRKRAQPPASRMVQVAFDDLPDPIRMLVQDLADAGADVTVCLIESDPFSQAPVDRKIASSN